MSWTSIARSQAGLITRAQLGAAGVPWRTSDYWLRTGRLEATRTDSVYRVGGSAHTAETAAWYAVLATRSPLSFVSAAAWWELPVEADGPVHITRFDRRRLDWPPGVRVHRVALAQSDVVERRGLWMTTRVVTVLDCVGSLAPARALALADRAVQQRWVTTDDFRRRLENEPHRWGNKQLRRIADTIERGAEAESERRLHRLLRASGINGWVPQLDVLTPAGRFRVDVAFPAYRLALEVDGYAYHSGDARFQRDRTKQNALLGAGWRVLRFTWADIVERPDFVIAQIASILAA